MFFDRDVFHDQYFLKKARTTSSRAKEWIHGKAQHLADLRADPNTARSPDLLHTVLKSVSEVLVHLQVMMSNRKIW